MFLFWIIQIYVYSVKQLMLKDTYSLIYRDSKTAWLFVYYLWLGPLRPWASATWSTKERPLAWEDYECLSFL